MFTKSVWDSIVFDDYDYGYKKRIDVFDIFLAIVISFFTIQVDILLSPLEIIAFIIWKIIKLKIKEK